MRNTLLVFVLATLFVSGLLAQATQKAEQPNTTIEVTIPGNLATREDVNRVETKLEKGRIEAARERVAAKKAAEEQAAQTRAVADKTDALRREIVAQAATDKQAAAEKAMKEEAQSRESAKRMKWVWGVGAVAFCVIVALGVVFVRSYTKAPEVRVVPTTHASRNGILTDPNIEALEEYSRQNKNVKIVPFSMTLSDEGLEPRCEAELREGLDPQIITVNGKKLPLPITWKNRRDKVARFLERERAQYPAAV